MRDRRPLNALRDSMARMVKKIGSSRRLLKSFLSMKAQKEDGNQ